MIPLLDITKDVCPMTFVKVKMALAGLGPPGKLDVLLSENALKNVISSLKAEGHVIAGVTRRETVFLLRIDKAASTKGDADT
jgi:tRNA 2-thiouridine synthesizing protein A